MLSRSEALTLAKEALDHLDTLAMLLGMDRQQLEQELERERAATLANDGAMVGTVLI